MSRAAAALRRGSWALAVVAVACGLVATLAYAALSIGRPLSDAEGNVLFEASRLRAGLPLYTDPLVGAFDYGPVPSRFYVLYPPVLPWIVSRLPWLAGPVALRAAALVAWLGLLAWIAAGAKAECRKAAWLSAALVASVFALAPFAASLRPDSFAVLAAGLGLARAAKKGRVDAVAAALFAIAPFIKPNVVGLGAGAILLDLAACRVRALGPLAVALAITLLLFGAFEVATHGAFLVHLRSSTAQPMSLVQWRSQIPGRLQFLGLPLLVAGMAGARGRRDPGVRLALGALVVSAAWAVVSAAKIGSSACYWMESCVAALVLVARAPLPRPSGAGGLLFAAGALVQALWIEVASVRSAFEALSCEVPAERRVVETARATCAAGPGEVLLADDVGVEVALNGRAVDEPFPMTHLVRAGRYPEALWAGDIARPQVVGVVVRNDLLERPLSMVSEEYDRFPPGVRLALQRFHLRDRQGDWRVYCARGPAGPGSPVNAPAPPRL